MHSILLKRIFEISEEWFSAFLFPFKLFTVLAAVGPLIWCLMLPIDTTSGGKIDLEYFMAVDDFRVVAFFVGLLYFLSSCVLVIGGCVQLFKHSSRAALWNVAFGLLAFFICIVLERVGHSLPSKYDYLSLYNVLG
ncbi:MAG: hypothetical protein WDM80_03830 [Limisphaerales bacterium]